jgi:hypothetical protein
MLVLAGYVAGCERADYAQRTALAKSETWEVFAIGELNAPAGYLSTDVVQFQAVRNGKLFAEGPLYAAGSNDQPFNRRYTRTQWIGRNTLHFWFPPAEERGRLRVSVHNAGTTGLRWLKLNTYELFLLLDIGPGEVIDLPLWRWGGDYLWFTIEGEFVSGQLLRRNLETSVRDSQGVRLTIRDMEVSISP